MAECHDGLEECFGGGRKLSHRPSRSINLNASLPDTRYSKSLAISPQVFTLLGTPLGGTNTVDVTLDFPAGAHTAGLLYCGLGSDIVGGGWRQYFPDCPHRRGHLPCLDQRKAPRPEWWGRANRGGLSSPSRA